MKKWLIVLLVLVGLGIGAVYIFIPSSLKIVRFTKVKVNSKAFARNFTDVNNWNAWWPSRKNNSSKTFTLNNRAYSVVEERLSSFAIAIRQDDSLKSELIFIPISNDSITLTWNTRTASSNNPLARLQTYFSAKSLAKDMDEILQALQNYYQNEKNLYNISIKKDLVVDSTLISTFTYLPENPTTENIYALIDKLQVFVAAKGAKQTGFPMVNSFKEQGKNYRLQVALPIDRKLNDEGDIVYRWMLGGGKILTTEVEGGPHSINNAFNEMETYINDFQRTAPAIPFQSLITDRRKEPDTSKWVTKLYWPVM